MFSNSEARELAAALDPAWTKFYVPCSAATDLAPGEGHVGFRCGYDPQKQLTQKTWWTDATVKTDAGGRADVRGFLGDYEITAFANGKTITSSAALPREGSRVEMQIR